MITTSSATLKQKQNIMNSLKLLFTTRLLCCSNSAFILVSEAFLYLFLFLSRTCGKWKMPLSCGSNAAGILPASFPVCNILRHRHILVRIDCKIQRNALFLGDVTSCRYFLPTCLMRGHLSPSLIAICIRPPHWAAWSINTPKKQTLMSNCQIRWHVLMLIYGCLSLCFQRNNAWNVFIHVNEINSYYLFHPLQIINHT